LGWERLFSEQVDRQLDKFDCVAGGLFVGIVRDQVELRMIDVEAGSTVQNDESTKKGEGNQKRGLRLKKLAEERKERKREMRVGDVGCYMVASHGGPRS
jgi:hypothetical protein